MADVTLPGDYTESANFGAALELSAMNIDYKGQRATIVYEARDTGGNWLGRLVTIKVETDGATVTKLNGDVKLFPTMTWAYIISQGLIDKGPVHTFVQTNGGDLRSGT